MIIDQLFEDDDKKKKLNEIDPRNYDSDEDYYNDLHGKTDDDDDFVEPDDYDDNDFEEPESYYEKSLRSRGLGEAYDPGQSSKYIAAATKAAKIIFDFERGYNQAFRSELANQYGFDPDTPGIEVSPHNATELIKWLTSKGCKLSFNKKEPIEFSLSMPDQAQPYTFNILDMIQGGEVEESLNEFDMPVVGQATGVAAQNDNKPRQTYSVKIVGQFTGPRKNIQAEQVWLALETILPRDYPRVPYQQQSYNEPQRRVVDDINEDGFSIVKQGINSLDIAETIAGKFESKGIPAEVIDGGLYEEGSMDPMPEFYAGQEITWRPKFAKMVPVPVTVVASAPGKLKIKLQSPRMIQNYGKEIIVVNVADSDIMPKQGVAEAKAATARFRAGNKKRAELNAMSDEERRAYDKEQQEKQRRRDDARLEREREKLAAKKKDKVTESRRYKLEESRIVESSTYKQFYRVGQMLSERKMTDKEITDLFGQIEAGMTNKDTGANRTALGRGKDTVGRAYTNTKDAITNVLSSIQNSAPVAGVDVAYDKATDALANVPGANKVMDSIKKYRLLAKEYPKTQMFVKTALIALAGLATGGAALPAIAGVTAAIDAAIKGEKLSSIIGKGAGAALMGLGAQKLNAMLSGGGVAQIPGDNAHDMDMMSQQGDAVTPQPGDPDFQLPADSVAANAQVDLDAAREWINADAATRAEIEQITGMSPAQLQDIAVSNDLISNADSLAPGEEIVPPGGDQGLPGQFAGGQYTVVKGDQLGKIAQAMGVKAEDIKALNPQIEWSKPLQPGMTLNLPPQGDGTGSVWDGYTGGVYGDKAAAAANTASNAGPATDVASNAASGATRSMAGPNDAAGADQFYNPTEPSMSPEQIAASQAYTDAVNAPAPAGYTKGIAYDEEGNLLPGWNAQAIGGKPYNVFRESIKFKVIPAEQLIDQKLTVLSWALNESVNRKGQSVHLTNKGVYTVFENVDRYRKAILEAVGPGREQLPDYYRPDMAGAPQPQTAQPGMIGRGLKWLDKAAGKVGGALSNFGHQFTTGVTKEKLKMNWHQAGKPTDSDQVAAFLAQQKVPQEVITDVFGQMGIPYTAPASAAQPAAAQAAGRAQKSMPFYGTNPATGKAWTRDELSAKSQASATATAAAPQAQTQEPATAPQPGAFNATNVMQMPGMQQYAKPPVKPATKPNFAQQMGGYAQVNQPTTVSYGTKPPVKPTTPAAQPVAAGPGGAYNAKTGAATLGGKPMVAMKDLPPAVQQRLGTAVAENINKMFNSLDSKDDVQKLKQYIDRQFVKHGLVSEGAQNVRNNLIERATQIAAVRRREKAAL